jgi:hypothetical protein
MGLWMLSFGDHDSAIVEAESIAHARLRVAVKGLIRASLFAGGCQIDSEFIPLIPNESIGRKLTREHTSGLLELLKHGPPRREVIGPPVQMLAMPAPRAGRRARLSMAEHLADNRQSEPGARVPQVVDAR